MRPILLTAAAIGLANLAGAATVPDKIDFDREVRPVLERRCLGCHSGRAGKPQGGLALDSRTSMLRGGASGPALIPGDPQKSLLLRAIGRDTGVPAMPPGGRLPEAEVAMLTRWVAAGAPWPAGAGKQPSDAAHWAFQPLRRPPAPRVKNPAWVQTPIDAFILARLEAKGLSPAPPADYRTLIRRATFDLTGLPPTPEEVNAFVRECQIESAKPQALSVKKGSAAGNRGSQLEAQRSRPKAPLVTLKAYERLVDRLLASPRYGERWGRHWLDVVHYGDTHGYDKDKRRDHAWPYRDYVIRSFNEDKPYDRFVQEQIAGDVLFPDSPDGVVATGFIAAGPWDFVGQVELREGTVEKEKTRVLDRDDMVANTLSTFDSITIHCARCHNHKFDPIPQKEYYQLQAVFAGVERGDRPFVDPQARQTRAALERQLAEQKEKRDALLREAAAVTSPELEQLDSRLREARARLAAPRPQGSAGSPTNGYHSSIEPRPDVEKWVEVDLGRILPLDEVLIIPARPTDFRDAPGFGFPARFRVAVSNNPSFQNARVLLDATGADVPNPGDEVVPVPAGCSARYVRITATRLWPRTNDYIFALGELQVLSGGKNVAAGAAVTALDSIEAGRWARRYLVDGYDSRNRLPDPSDPAVVTAYRERAALQSNLRRLTVERTRLADSLLDPRTRKALSEANATVAALTRELAALPAAPQVYAVLPHAPRPIHVLARGEVDKPGEEVAPGALSCVSGLSGELSVSPGADEGQRRAALARWVTSPKNALTWRSIVNRVWHYHFGRGLVETPNDFGKNGAPPSHPELLDWLAAAFGGVPGSEFRVSGGAASKSNAEPGTQNPELHRSLKALHRLIMLSATYQQACIENPAYEKIDADNRFLWRMNRQRLDAESVRDAVLAVSGKLDLTMGGPGFDLFRFKDDHSPVYDHTAIDKINDPETFRRTVYRFTVRSVPNPFLESLDCADPNINTPVRSTTITALQALALLNDPFMLKQSEYFAARLKTEARSPEAQITAAYQRAFGRAPNPAELRAVTAFARKHGLAHACRLLFNTNEFVFVE